MSIFDILVHPISKLPLIKDDSGKSIHPQDSLHYTMEILEGIPLILPLQNHPNQNPSNEHRFEYRDHYQKDAEAFDYFKDFENSVDSTEKQRLNQMILSKIPDSACNILDVGCGNGWLSQAKVNEKAQVISMDISTINPIKAVQNLKHKNHFGLIADAYHLPIAENSVDCIIASEIMEHVIDPKLFIQKLLYPLQKGGKLIITTPYNEDIPKHLCVHCNHLTPSHGHLHSFNEANIQQLLPPDLENKISKFSNKYASKIRLYAMTKNWSFALWSTMDKMANSIAPSPMRLMIEIYK